MISTSWGQCEAQTGAAMSSAENLVFEQAAVQGQSVVAASGDDGSSDCATKALAVDDPASQPYVTGVGGTLLNALGPPPVEVTWNVSASSSGASGGASRLPLHAVVPVDGTVGAARHQHVLLGSAVWCSDRRVLPRGARRLRGRGLHDGYLTYSRGDGRTTAEPARARHCGRPSSRLLTHRRVATARASASPIRVYEAAATSYTSDFHDITSGTTTTRTGATRAASTPLGLGTTWQRARDAERSQPRQDPVRSTKASVEPTSTALSLRVGSVAIGSESPRPSRCARPADRRRTPGGIDRRLQRHQEALQPPRRARDE